MIDDTIMTAARTDMTIMRTFARNFITFIYLPPSYVMVSRPFSGLCRQETDVTVIYDTDKDYRSKTKSSFSPLTLMLSLSM
jgi:hypothetical protein